MSQRRRGRPERRRSPQKRRKIIRIHTEGEVTERRYLKELGRRHRDKIQINIGVSGQVPLSLVDKACQDLDDNQRRRQRNEPLYEEIWCVFDVDEHPNIVAAIDRAQRKGVRLAVSNPCFELWLVLHSQDQTAYIDRHAVQREARKLGLIEGKSIIADAFDDLDMAYEHAKRRAKSLDRKHHGDGSPPRSNPSTGMWRLVDSIRMVPSDRS